MVTFIDLISNRSTIFLTWGDSWVEKERISIHFEFLWNLSTVGRRGRKMKIWIQCSIYLRLKKHTLWYIVLLFWEQIWMSYLIVRMKSIRYFSFQGEKQLFEAIKESCLANSLRCSYPVVEEIHVHYELKSPWLYTISCSSEQLILLI